MSLFLSPSLSVSPCLVISITASVFSQILRAKEACVPEEDSSDQEDSLDEISENSDSYEKENDPRLSTFHRKKIEYKNDLRKERERGKEEWGTVDANVTKEVDIQKKIPWITNRKNGVLTE